MINLDKIVELSATIEIDETENKIGTSAYGVWKVAAEVFEKLDLPFSSTSQSFYNYAKTGKINGTKSSTQKFTDEEVENFVAILIAKATK